MFQRGSRFDIRRKSFDPSDVKKPALTGTVGNNLGFWMTAFLGFQTLGAIYGLSPPLGMCLTKIGDIGTSPLYVFTGYVI
jgi:hypothetical protein